MSCVKNVTFTQAVTVLHIARSVNHCPSHKHSHCFTGLSKKGLSGQSTSYIIYISDIQISVDS